MKKQNRPQHEVRAERKAAKERALSRRNMTILTIACGVAVVLAVVLLLIPEPAQPERPPFTPPPFDSGAIMGEPTVDESLGWSEMSVREDYAVHVCGVLNVQDGKLPVWFYSHPENGVWVKLRLLDEKGNILGETGILKPGEYTEFMTLNTIPAKDGPVTLRVMGYEPETYYSAGSVALSTELNV